METEGRNTPPSPTEAKQMLDMARAETERTANPPLSWGFFTAMAVLTAAACAGQVLEGSARTLVTIVAFAGIVLLGIRRVFYRSGYGVVWPDGLSVFPYMVTGFIVVGIPAVLAVGFEMRWLWLLSAIGAAMATLIMGARYRRAVNRRG